MKTTNKRLLLIEDNEQDEILTIKAFASRKSNRDSQYHIEVRRDGAEAIKFFTHPPEKRDTTCVHNLDLILLDLNLPKFSGFDVLRKIRSIENVKHVPVVILSTSTDPEDIRKSYELGANSVIKKPVDYSEFKNIVSLLKDYWLNKNQVHHSLQY